MHLLLVEDDPRLRRMLVRLLGDERHVVDEVGTGEDGLEIALGPHGIDAIILDIGLPGISGLEVARRIRAAGSQVPILMLTARDTVGDRVTGLDSGADDYLVKPFAFEELSARIRALGRRSTVQPPALAAGTVELDVLKHEVRVRGERVDLSPTEYRLLEVLMRNAGRALSRPVLLSRVWGYDDEPESNAVDLYVHYLRRKLGDAVTISTVRGVGYRFDGPA